MVSFFGMWMQRDNLAQAMWMFFGLLALVLLLAGALGFILLRRGGRVYSLGSANAGASNVVKPGSSNAANTGSTSVVKLS
jgi:hypothetical protein